MDPDQLVQRAKEIALDGVCITEHNQLWSKQAIDRLRRKHHFLVIGGVEVSTDCGDILVFGLHRSVRDVFYLQDLRRMVVDAGAVMILAHPFRSERGGMMQLGSLYEHNILQMIEGIEVYNGQSGFQEKRLAKSIAERFNLSATGGSDAHAILGVGACYTVFEEEVQNEQDLISHIRNGQCRGVDPRWNK
jgi:predicted metal-dependent phosphoesterase TrpH